MIDRVTYAFRNRPPLRMPAGSAYARLLFTTSHDHTPAFCTNSIFFTGLVPSGTNPPLFPLRVGRPYRMVARGEGGHLNLDYHDEQGKTLASRFLLRPTPEGVAVDLIPPAGAVAGRVVMYGVLLDAFTVSPGP